MKNQNKMIVGSAMVIAAVIPSCKMPPQQAWRQIQTEGLVSYMGAEPMRRQIASQSRQEAKPVPSNPSVTQSGSSDWLTSILGNPASSIAKTQTKPLTNRPQPQPASTSSFFGNSLVTKVEEVPGQPGYVYSPYDRTKMVDVSKFEAGQEVRCPHTGGLFVVPSFDTTLETLAPETGRIASTLHRGVRMSRERSRQRFRIEPNTPAQPVGPDSVEIVGIQIVTPDPAPVAPIEPKPIDKPDGLTAIPVPGRPNQVYSPYASKNQIVDITGIKPGDKARCPYSNRVFVVPGGSAPMVSVAPPLKQKPGTRQPATKPERKKTTSKIPEKPMIAPKIEKPVPAPQPKLDPEPKPIPAPAPTPEKKPATDATGSVPTASWSDKSGYAESPFGGHLVDVTGKAAGTSVRCPFSGKQFKVPSGSN